MIKKIAKIAVGALFLAVITTATANAQTNSYRTNVLLNLTFSLTAYEQTYVFLSTNGFSGYGPTAKTSKVATDGVIRAIAKQAHITNDLSSLGDIHSFTQFWPFALILMQHQYSSWLRAVALALREAPWIKDQR